MEPVAKLDPMTETALRSLHDIAVPPPVSWMPQTWGWAVLAVLVAGCLLLWFVLAYKKWRRNAYRREALRLLGAIERGLQDSSTRERAIHELAALLKRTALAAWKRADVAAINGAEWVRFLDEKDNAGHALDQVLNDLEYRQGTVLSALSPSAADEIVLGARRWIETHHVST